MKKEELEKKIKAGLHLLLLRSENCNKKNINIEYDKRVKDRQLYTYENIENLLKINNIEYKKYLFYFSMKNAILFVNKNNIEIVNKENENTYIIKDVDRLYILFNLIYSNFDFNYKYLKYIE